MAHREKCYCPGNPMVTCAACVPSKCACGRRVPVAALRKAYRANKGVRCTACGARKDATEVAIDYLGL